VSNAMVEWRSRTGIDDTLDVFPCHGVGGIVGMILTGVFASGKVNPAVTKEGLFFGENSLFLTHLLTMAGVSVFAFGGTWLLLRFTNAIVPMRVSAAEEAAGLDATQHGEKL
jgi:ammonium transporter, Amt family